ncbi:MAG TPA: PAS domain S-box protein, partial [Terriglobales bacterium]
MPHISPPSRQIKVLVFEDDTSYAYVITKHLRLAGFVPADTVVATREEFSAALQQPEFDVILSDYKLEGWTGMDAYQLLRSMDLDIPFVLISASVGEEKAVECLNAGVADYLLKENIARIGPIVTRIVNERQMRKERDLAMEEAKRGEQLYRLLFSATPLSKWIFDARTLQIMAVNEVAVERYGYSEKEFMGLNVYDLLLPGIEPLKKDFFHKRAAGKGPDLLRTCQHRTKDGSIIDVEIYSRDIDFQGRPAWLWTIQDITERKRMEDMLRSSEELHRSLFERNVAAVFRSTIEGEVLACNDAFVKLFGLSGQEEAKVHKAQKFYANAEVRAQFVELLLERGALTNVELPMRRKDGTEGWMLLNASLLPDAKGEMRVIQGTMLDITHIRQLQRRQRLDMADQIAGGVAHDFNNLLMIIHVNVDILEQRSLCGPAGEEYLSNIRNAAARGQKLTHQLLAFSQKQILRPHIFGLNQLLREHITMLKPLMGEDIQLSIRPGPELPSISADPLQIEQVIMNLVLNARDAMPKGGKIRIETLERLVEKDGPPWMPPGKYVVMSIEDTGSGMDERTRSRIFEPFFTTKGPGRGTGLGLAVVHGIVKQAGGFIDVDSVPGEGTKFSLSFPVVEVQEAQPLTPALGAARVGGSG